MSSAITIGESSSTPVSAYPKKSPVVIVENRLISMSSHFIVFVRTKQRTIEQGIKRIHKFVCPLLLAGTNVDHVSRVLHTVRIRF